MEKDDVVTALKRVQEARDKWNAARREFDDGLDRVLNVLLHEAARNYLSPTEVAKHSGLPRTTVTRRMRLSNLDPNKHSRTVLSEKAAKALNENAELMGIKPAEMDLTSPLAYLPMGDQMRRELYEKTAPAVTEFPPVYQEGSDEFSPEWLAYLASLTTEVGEGRFRLSHKDGRLVRVELWTDDKTHFDFPVPS